MNTGVSTVPWARVRRPRRAWPDLWRTWNRFLRPAAAELESSHCADQQDRQYETPLRQRRHVGGIAAWIERQRRRALGRAEVERVLPRSVEVAAVVAPGRAQDGVVRGDRKLDDAGY